MEEIVKDSIVLNNFGIENVYEFVVLNRDLFEDIFKIDANMFDKNNKYNKNNKNYKNNINNIIETIKITHKYNMINYYADTIKYFVDMILFSDIPIIEIRNNTRIQLQQQKQLCPDIMNDIEKYNCDMKNLMAYIFCYTDNLNFDDCLFSKKLLMYFTNSGMYNPNIEMNNNIINRIAKYATYDILDLLNELGNACMNEIRKIDKILFLAGEYGNLCVTKWFWEKKNIINECIFYNAASYGNIDIIIWGNETHTISQKNTLLCKYAAEMGHIEILKYLHTNEWPWDVYTCASAARYGNISVLQWLIDNGCPVGSPVYIEATKGGKLDILKWFVANGYNINRSIEDVAYEAGYGGYIEILEWLIESFDFKNLRSVCLGAICSGKLSVLVWAKNKGQKFDENMYVSAIFWRNKDIINFLWNEQ